ncbi:hypothetical protein Ddye_013687 [Dipteronia dyeriana]|uniref:Pentatricopeptide repeat-containing protein n=1 Tax=Dipteronia dyeriana TaxID=168575 RepID=A0AAE0CJW2_9ROSI|nr:hypothetical protein Ddye_013687 [Dipteronia dyeriana]
MARFLELEISNLLQKCRFQHLKQIQALIITTSLSRDLQILSKFLRRTTEFGSMDYSDLIFSQMDRVFDTEIVIWNTMIRGYAYNGPHEKCLSLFNEIPQRGLEPDSYTYPYVFNACSEMGSYRDCYKLHCRIVKSGFESSFAVTSSLFNMYIKKPDSFDVGLVNNGKLSDARRVFDDMCVRPVEFWNKMMFEYVKRDDMIHARQLFDEMPERDFVSWNSMISGFAKARDVTNARDFFERMPEKNVVSWTLMIGAYSDVGDLETARKFFNKIPRRNVVSWNSMISSFTQRGKFEQALDLFMQMQSDGIVPDRYTFVSVLSACSHLGDLEFGKWIHYLIGDWSRLGVILGTALVDMYAKCGDIDRAFSLFIKIGKKDVFSWNVMIKSLAIHGRTEEAFKMFLLLEKIGVKPNEFTFTSVLFACSHGGLVEEGCRIFYSMERDFGVKPKLEHFGCLVDLLSRKGQVEKAELLIKDMPFEPDIAIWGALLGGCRVRNDLKLAEKVIEKATALEANEPGVYALLSNIHAAVGQWPEALSARDTMEDRKLHKTAGISSVV